MSLIRDCKQNTANSCEWKCIKRLDKRDGMAKKKRGGEAGGRRGSDLMEANSTGFVKYDLITSSPVCWDLCLFSLSTVLDTFSLSILFFAAFNSAANLIKLTITLRGKHTHTGGGLSEQSDNKSKGGFLKTSQADSQHLPKPGFVRDTPSVFAAAPFSTEDCSATFFACSTNRLILLQRE